MRKVLFFILMLTACIVWAQEAQSVPVTKSNAVQTINGRRCYCHIVQRGQTVYSISRAYGVSFTETITRTDIHQLHVGDTVWVPCHDNNAASTLATQTIVVQPKQTLYGISREHGITMEELVALNPELENSTLQIGQRIKVPATAQSQTETTDDPFGTGAYDYTTYSTPSKSKPQEAAQAAQSANGQAVSTNVTPTAAKAEEPKTKTIAAKKEQSKSETATTQSATGLSTVAVAPAPTTTPVAANEVFPYPVHDRLSPNKLYISLLMPLNLSDIDKISTTKFDVDQRGKREYKTFEMLQFYEGMLIGLEELKKKGYNIVINVVDIPYGAANAVKEAYTSHNVAHSDFIIALLEREAFSIAASLANEDKVFIINPVSTRTEIVTNSPYVIKMQPSPEGTVSDILNVVANMSPKPQLYIIHSNGKLEKAAYNEFQSQLTKRNDIQYTYFDWAVSGKLASVLKQSANCAVVSIYDQGKDKNRIFSNMLLNKLITIKNSKITLFTLTNYLTEYNDIDYSQLQRLDYHMPYPYYMDYNNEVHRQFIEEFKSIYKTEPSGRFAGMGHDVILYFATGLHNRGVQFWKNCATTMPQGMLFPLHFRQQGEEDGFENQLAPIYRMRILQIEKVTTR